jgi:peptidoglycan/xylan/chitin deacetylase (PgdA/CDA1 family)
LSNANILKLAACLAMGLAAGISLLFYGVFARSSQVFGRSVWRGSGRKLRVALTFDDGPNPASLQLARCLAAQHVRATFFQCGVNVLRNPGIARQLHRAGHELGNHTFTHARLCPRLGWRLNLLTPTEIHRELTATQQAIVGDTGVLPVLFRAPYGMRWFGLRAAQRRLGLLGCMWTVIGHDWEWPVEQVVRHVLRNLRPGAIVCLHDGRDIRPDPDLTVLLAAVEILIPEIRRRGYDFVTVSELLRNP